jgi:hypothetical protein
MRKMGILELVWYTWTGGRRFREAKTQSTRGYGARANAAREWVTHAVLVRV